MFILSSGINFPETSQTHLAKYYPNIKVFVHLLIQNVYILFFVFKVHDKKQDGFSDQQGHLSADWPRKILRATHSS